MKFGSWTYDGHEVDLQHICDAQAVYLDATKEKVINRGIDIKDFYPTVEWDIINVTDPKLSFRHIVLLPLSAM
jgi:nicotinic acetylcholine receptor